MEKKTAPPPAFFIRNAGKYSLFAENKTVPFQVNFMHIMVRSSLGSAPLQCFSTSSASLSIT